MAESKHTCKGVARRHVHGNLWFKGQDKRCGTRIRRIKTKVTLV